MKQSHWLFYEDLLCKTNPCISKHTFVKHHGVGVELLMQELISCPSKSKGNEQGSLPSNVEQPESCECMISITNIITFNLTGCLLSCFVFQPNIEFAAELNMFCPHDPDPLHEPSIIDPSNILQTRAQFKLGCPIAFGIQSGLEVCKYYQNVGDYLFATPQSPALICISLSALPVITSVV